ncbi:MAG: type IV toxin-antitoxin system AbiEi family antitoxin domain-containing protein, partial [Candidatus Limnocylindrales bacterium]
MTGEQELAAIADQHHGVLTTGLALERGIGLPALRHHESRGRLLRIKRGIYRVRGHPVTWESRLTMVHEAAVLAAIGGRGRPGTALVRELLKRFGPRYQPTKSDAESLFVELIEVFD